jgi:hypothetical protein
VSITAGGGGNATAVLVVMSLLLQALAVRPRAELPV